MPKTKTIVIFLLAIMFAVMIGSSWGDSGIEDERPHIVAGYSYLTTGDYRINPEHPPLIKDLAALPLVLKRSFTFPYDYWRANLNSQWELGHKFLYSEGNNPDEILFLARFPMILISLGFGLLIFKWAAELYGEKAGLFALFLYAFDANIIAHSRFVTTDLGISLAFFLNLYFLWKFLKKPVMKYFLLAGLTFGVVLITKFSAALLVPIYGLIFILELIKGREEKLEDKRFSLLFDKKFIKKALGYILSFILIGLMGVMVMYLFYIPHIWNMTRETQRALIIENLSSYWAMPMLQKMVNITPLRPIAQYLLGFFMVSAHVTGGHRVFFMGEVANGFRPYYIVTFLIKTAIPTLLFLASMLYLMVKKNIQDKKPNYDKIYLLIPFVVFYVMAIRGSINLGIRYLLPVYPFIFLFVSDFANKVSLEKAKEIFRGKFSANALGSFVFMILLIWYAVGSLVIYPHYLSYFNEFIGGPKNGIKYIADSNLDWGQDLKRLAMYVDKKKINSIAIDYFGSGDPDYYLAGKDIKWNSKMGKPHGYFAISASTYAQVISKFKDTGEDVDPNYTWLSELTPVDTIGYSILVFNVE